MFWEVKAVNLNYSKKTFVSFTINRILIGFAVYFSNCYFKVQFYDSNSKRLKTVIYNSIIF